MWYFSGRRVSLIKGLVALQLERKAIESWHDVRKSFLDNAGLPIPGTRDK